MASLLLQSPKTPEARAREIVLAVLRKQPRILIGEASLAIGPYWRLDATEALLEAMRAEGILRFTTEEENIAYDIQLGYALV